MAQEDKRCAKLASALHDASKPARAKKAQAGLPGRDLYQIFIYKHAVDAQQALRLRSSATQPAPASESCRSPELSEPHKQAIEHAGRRAGPHHSTAKKTMAVVVVGSANVDLVVNSPRFPKPGGDALIGSRFEQLFGGKGRTKPPRPLCWDRRCAW